MDNKNEVPSFKVLKQYLKQIEELQQIIIKRDAHIQMLSFQLIEASQPMDIGQLKSEIEHLSDKLKTITESQIVNSRQLAETNLQFERIIKETEVKCERFTGELQKLDEKDEEIAQLKQENHRLQKKAESLTADNVMKDTQLSHVRSRLKSCNRIFDKLKRIVGKQSHHQSHHQSEEVKSNRKRSATGSSKPETWKKLITEQQSEVIAETNHDELLNSPTLKGNEDDSINVDDSVDEDVQMDSEKWRIKFR